MIDAHGLSPDHFHKGTIVGVNLEALYKEHIGNSHHAALEEVFKAGAAYAFRQVQERENQMKSELEEFREKYNKFAAMVSAQSSERSAEPDMNQQAMKQALGMGKLNQ